MFRSIRLPLKGILIGIGMIIPGISAGTIALGLGLYDRLLAITNQIFSSQTITTLQGWLKKDPQQTGNIATLKETFSFLFKLGLGVLIGLYIFAHVMTFTMELYPRPTYFFLMGLMVGSLPAVYRAHKSFSFSLSHAVAWALGFFVMLLLSFIPQGPQLALATGTALSSLQILLFVLSGAIMATAMIMPGLSGSVILLLIGMYYPILEAVSKLNILILLLVALGIVLGLLLFTKFIFYFLKRYPVFTAYLIMGLIIGSLIKLWPGISYDTRGIFCVVVGIFGLLLGKKLG